MVVVVVCSDNVTLNIRVTGSQELSPAFYIYSILYIGIAYLYTTIYNMTKGLWTPDHHMISPICACAINVI